MTDRTFIITDSDCIKKTPYNFEIFDSEPELNYAKYLEKNDDVLKWTKHHKIQITYLWNGEKHKYEPDFLIEFKDGHKEIHELKGPVWLKDELNKAKYNAAKKWCEERNIIYKLIVPESSQ